MLRRVPRALFRRGARVLPIVALAGLVASVSSCSSPRAGPSAEPDPEEETTNPTTDAYAALEAADYETLPAVIDRLDRAFEAQPDEGRIAFYAGVMRLWRSNGGDGPLSDKLEDVLGAVDHLERARALRPKDPHVNAFLGITKTVLGASLGDERRIGDGRRLLHDSVGLYPAYLNGVMAQAFGVLPADHAYFHEALEAAEASLKACGPNVASGDEFSVTYPAEHSDPPGACWDEGVVAHVWEGIFLIYGDLAAKSGNAARAREFYGTAKQSPRYDAWPFAPELEDRLAAVEERTALYQDGDKTNDPPIWVQEANLCVGCHAHRR